MRINAAKLLCANVPKNDDKRHERLPQVVVIMESFDTVEEFAEKYGLAIDDPDIKRAYEAYEKNVWEWNSIISQAERDGRELGMKQGIEEGLEKGMEKGMEKLAAQLRALGVSEEAISTALELARSAEERSD